MTFPFWRKGRFLLWLLAALAKRYKKQFLWLSLVSFLFFLLAFIFGPFWRPLFNRSQTLRVGFVGAYNPQTLPSQIQNLASFGLTTLTESGEATPAAAKNFTISEDGKTYTFHLREDLLWQDGGEVKAWDINYNFKDVQVKVLDEKTIEFYLQESFSPFLTLVAQPLFKEGLVGLGNYQIKPLQFEGRLIKLLGLSPAKKQPLPPLKYKFYPTEVEAILAFKLGEIDVLEGLAHPEAFQGWPVEIVSRTFFNRYVAVFFNTQDSFFQEKGVRQALSYALPQVPEERVRSPLSPFSWAYNDDLKGYPYDLEMAKKILGKTKSATASAEKRVTLTTSSPLAESAEKVAREWEKLGIKTEVKIENKPQNFQALLAVQEISPDPDQYSFWHSTQREFNIARYQNPRIDKLLEDGRKLTKLEERLPKYLDFQKYLMDEAPAAFWYYPESYTISRISQR